MYDTPLSRLEHASASLTQAQRNYQEALQAFHTWQLAEFERQKRRAEEIAQTNASNLPFSFLNPTLPGQPGRSYRERGGRRG